MVAPMKTDNRTASVRNGKLGAGVGAFTGDWVAFLGQYEYQAII